MDDSADAEHRVDVNATTTVSDEATLIASLAAGDRGEPLGRLVDRYGGPLFGYGVRLLKDRGMAEEMVQDTFVRIWRGAGKFDPERGSARTWIYSIARNSAIDLLRRRSARPLNAEEPGPDSFGSVEPHEGIVERLEVRDALGTLSDKHRQVLTLAYDEGLTQSQIAGRLDVPVGTVKTRTFHALGAMREELQRRGFDG